MCKKPGCDPRKCRKPKLQLLSIKLAELANLLEQQELDLNQRVEEIIKQIGEELIELQALPSLEETNPTNNPDRMLSERFTSMSIEGSKLLTQMLTISVETKVDKISIEGANNILPDMLIISGETSVSSVSTETDVTDSVTTLRSPYTDELIKSITKLLRHILIG